MVIILLKKPQCSSDALFPARDKERRKVRKRPGTIPFVHLPDTAVKSDEGMSLDGSSNGGHGLAEGLGSLQRRARKFLSDSSL